MDAKLDSTETVRIEISGRCSHKSGHDLPGICGTPVRRVVLAGPFEKGVHITGACPTHGTHRFSAVVVLHEGIPTSFGVDGMVVPRVIQVD